LVSLSGKEQGSAKTAAEPVVKAFSPSLCVSITVVFLTLSLGVASVCADNKMPPTAPPIHRVDDQPSAASTDPGTATFIRRTEPVPAAAPLVGNVSRLGADGAMQSSAARYMARTAGLSAGTNVNTPGAVFRAWLEKTHPNFALTTSRIPNNQVIVARGAWDDSTKTLQKFGVPCTRIRAGQLDDYPLGSVKVLIIDCAGDVPRESFQRIRDFVSKGGYLLSTDWALDNMLQKTFPGYVEWNRKKNRRDMYDAEVTNPDPVLFKNAVNNANWRLDKECHLLAVLKPDAVQVIVRSSGLAHEDGQGILAVAWRFGRGEVLHLVGHFDNNPTAFRFGDNLPDPAPNIGISLRQAIAANFVVAGLTATHIHDR
jgi:hypothetical protein